mgnify:CR=1 FL=1
MKEAYYNESKAGALNEMDRKRLEEYLDHVVERNYSMLGYPASRDFDYSELYPSLRFQLNNVGDPWGASTCQLHSRELEQEVIHFFAKLFRAPESNYWGYVTNGGTEGNLYGLYLARELYPNAMVYYSSAAHYSIQKNLHLLNMESIVIRADKNGEMDYLDLKETVSLYRNRPAVILANIGTTMTEARDNVAVIKEILDSLAIRSYYIHSDGALAGTYSALLDPRHPFDFQDGADSIAVSGHKFIGSPFPCGIVLVKKSYKERIGQLVPYIGTLDTTITGSRNGHGPLFLWYAIKKLGLDGFRQRAHRALELAAYTEHRLREIGWNAWRNPQALTVVIDKPSDEIIRKWQLATQGDFSHIICMPGVQQAQIDALVADLEKHQNKSGLPARLLQKQ